MDAIGSSARERILAAAAKAFSQAPYERVGVYELCASAGVTTGALYHHFGGKPGLYRAVHALQESRLLDLMSDAANGMAPGPRAVRAALMAAWDHVQAQGAANFFAQSGPAGDAAISSLLHRLWPWGPAAVAPVLVAAWRGALAEALSHPEGDARLVLDGILRGIAADRG